MTSLRYLRLEPPITASEIALAAMDTPDEKAVGPDPFPAEFYKQCGILDGVIATPVTSTPERGRIPRELARSSVAPSDTVEGNPTRCESERPIALMTPRDETPGDDASTTNASDAGRQVEGKTVCILTGKEYSESARRLGRSRGKEYQ